MEKTTVRDFVKFIEDENFSSVELLTVLKENFCRDDDEDVFIEDLTDESLLQLPNCSEKMMHEFIYFRKLYEFRNEPVLEEIKDYFPMPEHKDLLPTRILCESLSEKAIKQMQKGITKTADLKYLKKSAVHMDNMTGTVAISKAYHDALSNFEERLRNENYKEARSIP